MNKNFRKKIIMQCINKKRSKKMNKLIRLIMTKVKFNLKLKKFKTN